MCIQYALHPVVNIGDCLNGQKCIGYHENDYIFQCTECCHVDRYSEFSIRNSTLQCKKCGLLAPNLVINVWRLIRPEWGSRTAWTCECVNCGCLRVMDVGEHADCSCNYGVKHRIEGENFKSLRSLHYVYGQGSPELAIRKYAAARPLAVCLGIEQEIATVWYKGIPFLNPKALLDYMGKPISLSQLNDRIKSCSEDEWFLPVEKPKAVDLIENECQMVYTNKDTIDLQSAIYNGKKLFKKDILQEFNITAKFYDNYCTVFETIQHVVDWLDYRRRCIEKAGIPASVFSRYCRAGVDISFLLNELSGTFTVNGIVYKTGYAALQSYNALKSRWLKKIEAGFSVYDLILENNTSLVLNLEFDTRFKELNVDGIYIYPCLDESGDIDYLTAEEMLNQEKVFIKNE